MTPPAHEYFHCGGLIADSNHPLYIEPILTLVIVVNRLISSRRNNMVRGGIGIPHDPADRAGREAARLVARHPIPENC